MYLLHTHHNKNTSHVSSIQKSGYSLGGGFAKNRGVRRVGRVMPFMALFAPFTVPEKAPRLVVTVVFLDDIVFIVVTVITGEHLI